MLFIIAAYSQNRVIGNKGKIPWNLPGEQKRFKELTMGNIVVMGRKSFEEIMHPLPGRITVVLSRSMKFSLPNCHTASCLQEVINMYENRNIFIAGGEKLYEEALPLAQKLFITQIDTVIPGDTFFPAFDESLFEKYIEARIDGIIPYTYITYTRK